MMDSKWLAIQSFAKNQSLLDLINKLLIHLKLSEKNIDARISADEIVHSKSVLTEFLKNLNSLALSVENDSEALLGVDLRLRKLVRNFMDARNKEAKFKSALFISSPSKILELLNSGDKNEKGYLIESLTELRSLIQDHVANDERDLIGEI